MAASDRYNIIETAAQLFNKKGYASTTVTDILLATGLARVGFYNNFRSKDEIARVALEYNQQAVMLALEKMLVRASNFRGQLEALIEFYENYQSFPVVEGGCPILNVISTEALPGLGQIALTGLNNLVKRVQLILKNGKTAGEFRSELEESQEANLIVAAIKGGMEMSQLSGKPEQLSAVLALLRVHFDNKYNQPLNGYQSAGRWQVEHLLPIHLS